MDFTKIYPSFFSPNKTKECIKCKKDKPIDIDNFYVSLNTLGGFTVTCRDCIDDSGVDYVGECGFVFCNRCRLDKPANTEYFNKNHTAIGFTIRCRECNFRKNRHKLTIKEIDGKPVCRGCFQAKDISFYDNQKEVKIRVIALNADCITSRAEHIKRMHQGQILFL